MNQKEFLLAIHLTKGIGLIRKEKIIQAIEAEQVETKYPWSFAELIAVLELRGQERLVNQLATAYQEGILLARNYPDAYLSYFDDEYPPLLKESYQAPLILFYKGDLRALQLPALAVVGTRTATAYGQEVLRDLLPPLLEKGMAIVSGLAKGIDVMAHQVTFAHGGVPIAVIGSGIGRAYPVQNRRLQEQVAEQGLLLSEYPRNVGPSRGHFPERNRIIAGLSQATLVVEAKARSGSLITANLALQNNREVFAVPGSIFSAESRGCHEIIQAGALPVQSVEDILKNTNFTNWCQFF